MYLILIFRRLASASPAVKAKEEPKGAKDSQSFTMNMFRGHLNISQVFPYPEVLTEDQSETLKMLVDPVSKFFDVSS